MPTIQDIQKAQGTRLQEAAPWETYAAEMGQTLSPELAAEVEAYAQRRYENAPISSESQEVLAEQKEINQEVAKAYQWISPDEYADYEARIGKVLSHADVINKLRKAGVSCWYTPHPHPDKLILLWSKNGGPRSVACWVQRGQMPELSLMNFDEMGAPLAERRRGWRTVVLQLILKGIISEAQVNRFFGKPRHDKAFSRYNATIQAFRNAGNSLG